MHFTLGEPSGSMGVAGSSASFQEARSLLEDMAYRFSLNLNMEPPTLVHAESYDLRSATKTRISARPISGKPSSASPPTSMNSIGATTGV